MKTRLMNSWQRLRTSFWFLPSLLTLAAFLLALGVLTIDEKLKRDGLALPTGIYKGGPEGARAVLSVVAASMISVTGVTFSITIVALTLASSQFGPRLLRNFMRDTGNQVVLGVFLATFIYCLMVLRRVSGVEDDVFVPHLAVTVGVGLALGSLGVLIYFIHHVAQSIQAENVIAAVGTDLDEAIEEFYPKSVGKTFREDSVSSESRLPENFDDEAVAVRARRTGYIQAVEGDELMRIAIDYDLILRVDYKPGDYIIAGSALVQAWPSGHIDEKLTDRINRVFLVGSHRTGEQDAEFAAHQLVEVALRALSPGINDTFTAINCIDRLGASLAKLAERVLPSGFRYDEKNRLRVVTEVDSFKGILNAAFDQIRQNGRDNAAVTIRLLEIIREIALHVHRPAHRAALMRQAEMIERASRSGLPEEEDRNDVQRRFAEAIKALQPAQP